MYLVCRERVIQLHTHVIEKFRISMKIGCECVFYFILQEKAESSSTQKKKVRIMASEPATVGGKEVRVEIKENDVDILNRDPEEINSYLKVRL